MSKMSEIKVTFGASKLENGTFCNVGFKVTSTNVNAAFYFVRPETISVKQARSLLTIELGHFVVIGDGIIISRTENGRIHFRTDYGDLSVTCFDVDFAACEKAFGDFISWKIDSLKDPTIDDISHLSPMIRCTKEMICLLWKSRSVIWRLKTFDDFTKSEMEILMSGEKRAVPIALDSGEQIMLISDGSKVMLFENYVMKGDEIRGGTCFRFPLSAFN